MSEHNTQILIVDDDPNFCRLIERYLSREGYHALVAHNADQMREKIDLATLVLLDLHLPNAHGIDLAREIREKSGEIGIIIVTGSTDEIDRIVGLEVGADDYVCKPFNERELLARIRSVMRRIDIKETSESSRYKFAEFELDMESHKLTRNGNESINLTGHEYNLLIMLLQRPSRVFTREEISRKISSREWVPTDRSVDVLVSKLRKKLESDQGVDLIKSLRGVGYQFSTKVEKL
ncbi:MAG: response regulator transcription factor [Pseudomonadales bacterium]|nr:response regulator transcription factor [Pseudomonadales bacterium]